jgi:ferredoxin/flavodoxin---NADP+ reductase
MFTRNGFTGVCSSGFASGVSLERSLIAQGVYPRTRRLEGLARESKAGMEENDVGSRATSCLLVLEGPRNLGHDDSMGSIAVSSPAFTPVRVVSVHDWDHGLKTVRVDHIPEDFVAGQFFQLALERGGKAVKRSYSAASAPGAPLEFYLSLVEAGELTPGLFEMEVGDSVGLDPKALGFFTLKEVPESKTLWLIATGTGLGPFVSMVRHGRDFERFEKIVLVHGARVPEQLGYRSELEKAAEENSKLTYIPVVSRSEALPLGLSGRITTAFSSGALEERAARPIDKDSHLLFCGNPQMIEEMVGSLKARGLTKHKRREPGHFNFEKYW